MPYFQIWACRPPIGVLVSLAAHSRCSGSDRHRWNGSACWTPNVRPPKRGWRRIGTAIVRWPGPILLTTIGIALMRGCWRCPATKRATTSAVPPDRAPSNIGYAAAERHFSKARLNPELLMVES